MTQKGYDGVGKVRMENNNFSTQSQKSEQQSNPQDNAGKQNKIQQKYKAYEISEEDKQSNGSVVNIWTILAVAGVITIIVFEIYRGRKSPTL